MSLVFKATQFARITARSFISAALLVLAFLPDDALGEARTNAASAAGAPESAERHWAFQPLSNPPVPAVKNRRWVQTDIDRFVLARLEAAGLTPNFAADKRVLLRRVTFDLTGLPPTPEEAETFLKDSRLDAFARVVERLLASPAYGERWGRHWLDLARYADTAGDSADYPVPQAYRYRNYVIDAFNRDKPYDQFLREQIAGDLLPADTEEQRREQIIATGFIASARRFSVEPRSAQHLTIEDTLDTLGRTIFGLSLSCARCHDHKYDPVSMRDYYALYGIFHSTRYPYPGSEEQKYQQDFVPLLPALELEQVMKPFHEKVARLRGTVADLEEKLGAATNKAARTTGKARTVSAEQIEEWNDALDEAQEALNGWTNNPPEVESAFAVIDSGKAGHARIQKRGEPWNLAEEVPRGFLKILGGQRLPEGAQGSGRRELADWVTAADNPLTARVMANRVWHYHFGRGLVTTPSDFGTRGRPPTHPELLDHLARRFIESGWSVKALHRLILLSAAYQQASMAEARAPAADPDNELLWKFNRRRLDAEELRDALLAVSGDLDRTPGGAHPFPPEQEWGFTQHVQFTALYETRQRSVYLMQQRIKKHPLLALFDGADPNFSTAERTASTTPLQALFALNDKLAHEQAEKFAARVMQSRAIGRERIELACQLAFGRAACREEISAGEAYLEKAATRLRERGTTAEMIPFTAWSSYARALLGSNEFLYVD